MFTDAIKSKNVSLVRDMKTSQLVVFYTLAYFIDVQIQNLY